jgi:putative ABC transport system ATP-binding protein
MTSTTAPLVTVDTVSRRFRLGSNVVDALVEVSARINSGEVTVIAGPSGSGKTTLLTILAGHETKDSGVIAVHPPMPPGAPIERLNWGYVGYVPQIPALLDELTVAENIELPARLAKRRFRRRDRNSTGGWATSEIMGRLEIDHLADRFPSQTSGGEQQRTAIARALRLLPPLIIADEPTGHQDRARVRIVLDTMKEYARTGRAVVIASHDDDVLAAADTLIRMQDGRLHTEWAHA